LLVYKLLIRNLKLNGAAQAIPHFCAVWNKSGEELFFPDPDFQRFASYGSYGLDPKAKAGMKVITQRIDDMDIPEKVSFIKVDIQGSDLFAMRGAKQLILRDKPILVFEFEKQFQKEFGTSFKDYQDFIAEIGYEVIETINRINFVIGPKKA
jgi:FkbM family methyltransferase